MKEIIATVTRRGQVTVPAEVRRLLDLKPGDRVAFTIEAGEARVRLVTPGLEAANGDTAPRRLEDSAPPVRAAGENDADRTRRKGAPHGARPASPLVARLDALRARSRPFAGCTADLLHKAREERDAVL